jgi:ubiquitin-activating enzyme E1
MVEEVKEEEIDTNLYSRQIGTFGLETMGTLMKMNVLIVGCRGLGVETAKNLILAGPRSVTIYDPTTVTFNDMGSNFYIKEENVANTTRAEASVVQLRELNPYVRTNTLPEFTDDMVTNYNLICITELMWNTDRVRAINEICRQHRIGFILCETLGLCSYTFLDYGPNFTVKDKDGEATKQFIVANVEQGENPRVNVHEDTRHTYQDGDYVKFVEVEGMTELNDAGPIEIFDSRAYDFRLRLDTSNFGAYTRQGIVEDEKVPK